MRVSEAPSVARQGYEPGLGPELGRAPQWEQRDAPWAAPAGHASCGECGAPARVHVLSRYEKGSPVIQHMCLACSEHESERLLSGSPRSSRVRVSVVIAVAGVVLGLLAVLADDVTWTAHAGFGWRQWGGAGLAGVMVFLGALVGVDFLLVAGLFLLVGSVGADWLGLTRVPGFGWKQQVLFMAGAAIVGMGVWGRLASVAHWTRTPAPELDK